MQSKYGPKKCGGQNFNNRDECRFCGTSWGAQAAERHGQRPTAPWHNKEAGGGSGKADKLSTQELRAALAKRGLETAKPGNGDQHARQGTALASVSAADSGSQNQPHAKEQVAAGWEEFKTKKQLKKERRKARQEETAKQEVAKDAPNTEVTQAEVTAMDVEARESAVPRKWTIDLESHYKSIKKPSVSIKERRTPEAHLQALLPKASAAAETIQAKKAEREKYLETLEQTNEECVKVLIKGAVQKLDEELASYKTDKATSKVKERGDLIKIVADLDTQSDERKAKLQKHEAARFARLQAFQAVMAEQKARMTQLEEQFLAEEQLAKKEWDEHNGSYTKHLEHVKQLASTKLGLMTQCDKNTEEKPVPTDSHAGVTPGSLQGDAETQRVIQQLEHRVQFQPEEMRDTNAIQPTEQEMPALAHVWAWTQGLMLEDPMSVIQFQHVGVDVQVIAELIGVTVWSKLFPDGKVAPEDVMPYQLRQMVAYQMRNLAARMSGAEHEEARKAGTEALNVSRKVIRTSTKQLKAARRNARKKEGGEDEDAAL